MPHRKVISPFKFLDSYKKDDFQSYFGRDKESMDFFELYKDSSIMILHGPSGSGKTSLIYCGLLNRIKREKKVLSIRRDEDLIEAIKKKLFIHQGFESKIVNNQSKLIDDFFLAQSDLNKVLVSIKHIEGMMLSVEEKIIKLKRKDKIVPTSTQPSDNTSVDDSLSTQELIAKYKERLQKFITERKGLLEQLRENNKQVTSISNEIYDYFMGNRTKNSQTPFTPLIIFDQFEELFVYGTEEEINKFGLFLKLIFEYKIPFNIIISLREEYFGHLDQLQSYVPHIFYKKIRLAHPNKDVIKNIIKKSFQEFNINQYKDHTKETLSDTEKDSRIELILNQIKIKDNESTSYHLPFLQVYLDSLYKVDYYRTYGDKSSQNNKEHLPLEFKEEEIKEFGSIEQVLENYIREVNNKIIKNTSNKLNDRVEHKDSVIKFLRHFKTKDDLKKRIPIQVEKDNYYVISNRKILDKIQKDIWGETNDLEYNGTISEIINKLKEKGILKVSTDQNLGADYTELSHDIIAKVISKIRTEDDFMLLIKKDFISSFDIYQDTKDKGDLLSTKQIERMNQCMEYIMTDDNADRLLLKKQFLKESIEETQKEELEQKRLEKRLKRFVYYPFIMTCLLFILAALAYSLIRLEEENTINKLSMKIHEKMGYALRDYNIDRTSSFNHILESEKILKKEGENKKWWHLITNFMDNESTSNFSENDSIFNIVKDFKNDFYKEYNKIPFYHNSVALGGDTLLATKTRVQDDKLYIFTLTSDSLILKSISFKEKNAQNNTIFEKTEKLLGFEPFKPFGSSELMTLIAKNAANEDDKIIVQLLNQKGEEQVLDKNKNVEIVIWDAKKLNDIEHQKGYSFLIGIDNKLIQLELDLPNNTYKISVVKEFNGEVRKIKTFKNNPEHYLVLYGINKLYFSNWSRLKNNIVKSNLKLEENDRIHTFKISNKDTATTVLLGLKGRIKTLNLKTLKAKNNYVHDEQINTIDVNQKGEMLLGSRDNGANLLSTNNMLLKQFMGHSKPIQNVSFVKENPNYITTSSDDKTLKIWNITPIADTINALPERDHLKPTNNDVSSLNEKKAHLLNSLSKETQSTLQKHIDYLYDIDYSKDKKYAISGSADNTAIIWMKTTSKYTVLQNLRSHTGDIVDVDFYNNDLVLTASSDNTVQIYQKLDDKNQFIQIPSLIRHEYSITSAAFFDNTSIISKDKKGHIKEWNFPSFDSLVKSRAYQNPNESLKTKLLYEAQ
ncbi:hypothetical protein [Aquimarina algiphila]|uniref:nSTAND1 domain-containing NTPase n=1 Tax=Aquimarina algiphila TaxID=2047982 RepID=UPI0024935162|nr:hypothetical protein [Aquimarina algiphila]